MVSRAEVINKLGEFFPKSLAYLEIGVDEGTTFFAVKARTKVAVDPRFKFPITEAKSKEPAGEFHEVTSDLYFSDIATERTRFDIIYLDGLHTCEQTLRDFTNSLQFLAEDGIVVIDDVIPNSYHASLPDPRIAYKVRDFVHNSDDSWMGDVYKLVFFIESYFPSCQLRTVSDNHGQAIVWKGKKARALFEVFDMRKIADLQFQDVIEREGVFHKLTLEEIYSEILESRTIN
jgi:Methyltransferase domain